MDLTIQLLLIICLNLLHVHHLYEQNQFYYLTSFKQLQVANLQLYDQVYLDLKINNKEQAQQNHHLHFVNLKCLHYVINNLHHLALDQVDYSFHQLFTLFKVFFVPYVLLLLQFQLRFQPVFTILFIKLLYVYVHVLVSFFQYDLQTFYLLEIRSSNEQIRLVWVAIIVKNCVQLLLLNLFLLLFDVVALFHQLF